MEGFATSFRRCARSSRSVPCSSCRRDPALRARRPHRPLVCVDDRASADSRVPGRLLPRRHGAGVLERLSARLGSGAGLGARDPAVHLAHADRDRHPSRQVPPERRRARGGGRGMVWLAVYVLSHRVLGHLSASAPRAGRRLAVSRRDPRGVSTGSVAVGLFLIATGALLFVVPSTSGTLWPWE